MSLQANTNTKFIPTKTLKLYPDARVNIKADGKGTSQLQYTIPSYLNFIDPRSLRLRYNLTMTGRGQPKVNPVAACHALWRHMRLQTYDGLNILEELDEVASAVAMQYSYSQDEGVIADRELNEGLSLTDNNQQQLFWPAQPTPTATIVAVPTGKKVAINQPLYSGILGKTSKVVPVAAMGGLRLTLHTNTIKKAIGATPGSSGSAQELAIAVTVPVASWNDASLNTIVEVQCTGSIVDGNLNPFVIGDRVYATDAVAGFADVSVGIITAVGITGANIKLSIRGDVPVLTNGAQILTAVNTKLHIQQDDRFDGWTPGANFGGVGAALLLAVATAPTGIDYTIEDVEMICEQVQPPPEYVSSMVKKINSNEGLEINYKNTTLYKVNVVGTNGLLNASIPNTATRGYAVNVMPLNSTDTNGGNNLTCVGADGAQSYQFVINGQLIPDQRCSMRRMSLTPAYVEQLHLQEVRKALINSGVELKSLQNAEKNVLISRAFSKYGAVSDTTKSDLSLRVEYVGAVRQKTLNCYFCSTRTLIIRAKEMQVVY